MFEIGWSELLVIGVVLIVVVGPKDLPRMLRTFGKVMTQARRMAGDFRQQFDEALREADLDDVRTSVNEMRSLNPTNDIRKALNPIRAVGDEIRSSLAAATKSPEPKIPAADAPAVAVAPADMMPVEAASAEPVTPTMASSTADEPVVAATHSPTTHGATVAGEAIVTPQSSTAAHAGSLPAEPVSADAVPAERVPAANSLNGAHAMGKTGDAQ